METKKIETARRASASSPSPAALRAAGKDFRFYQNRSAARWGACDRLRAPRRRPSVRIYLVDSCAPLLSYLNVRIYRRNRCADCATIRTGFFACLSSPLSKRKAKASAIPHPALYWSRRRSSNLLLAGPKTKLDESPRSSVCVVFRRRSSTARLASRAAIDYALGDRPQASPGRIPPCRPPRPVVPPP